MIYLIFDKSGELTNRIESGTQFVDAYCKAMGYTYSAEPVTSVPEPEPDTRRRSSCGRTWTFWRLWRG